MIDIRLDRETTDNSSSEGGSWWNAYGKILLSVGIPVVETVILLVVRSSGKRWVSKNYKVEFVRYTYYANEIMQV